jgi:hypothetical protein
MSVIALIAVVLISWWVKTFNIKEEIAGRGDVRAILTARHLGEGEGSLFRWDQFEILEVLQAEEGVSFTRVSEFAIRHDVAEFPPWPCRLELVPYNPDSLKKWRVDKWTIAKPK